MTSTVLKRSTKRGVLAVIDIGSSAIRVVITEITKDGWRALDAAEKSVALGRDVFTNGCVSRSTMLQALEILTAFQEMINAYPVTDTIAIGTSALREANNRDTFVDRVRLRTNLSVRIIEGIEANRLTYLAVREALEDSQPSVLQSNAVIMEVGGGSTEVMLLKKGNMVAAHTLPIGTIRLEQQFETVPGAPMSLLLRENIRSTLDRLGGELDLSSVSMFVALGGDARLAAERIGAVAGPQYRTIPRETFAKFARRLEHLTPDQLVNDLHISFSEAEPLSPALLVYLLFLEQTSAKRITVPSVSIREGVLLDYATGAGALRAEFRRQIVASAKSLARKYMIDQDHANQVCRMALKLFDDLETEHGMERQQRLLLEVAALIHDVGTFIRGSAHHKHGQYIIENSEIFGISPDENKILANVVRYHRKAVPLPSHISYMALTRKERVMVQKLAAILRVADALDRGHAGNLDDFRTEKTDDLFIIYTESRVDLSLERHSLKQKGNLFEEVFGLQVLLR